MTDQTNPGTKIRVDTLEESVERLEERFPTYKRLFFSCAGAVVAIGTVMSFLLNGQQHQVDAVRVELNLLRAEMDGKEKGLKDEIKGMRAEMENRQRRIEDGLDKLGDKVGKVLDKMEKRR